MASASASVVSSCLATGVASTWVVDSRYITPSGRPMRTSGSMIEVFIDSSAGDTYRGSPVTSDHRSRYPAGSSTSRSALPSAATTHSGRRWSKAIDTCRV